MTCNRFGGAHRWVPCGAESKLWYTGNNHYTWLILKPFEWDSFCFGSIPKNKNQNQVLVSILTGNSAIFVNKIQDNFHPFLQSYNRSKTWHSCPAKHKTHQMRMTHSLRVRNSDDPSSITPGLLLQPSSSCRHSPAFLCPAQTAAGRSMSCRPSLAWKAVPLGWEWSSCCIDRRRCDHSSCKQEIKRTSNYIFKCMTRSYFFKACIQEREFMQDLILSHIWLSQEIPYHQVLCCHD